MSCHHGSSPVRRRLGFVVDDTAADDEAFQLDHREAHTAAFGQDAYPNLLTKAAALLQSIVNHDALVDGNKRLGWLATAVFLELNGLKASRISNDDVYELVIWIASTNPSLDQITTRLTALVPSRRRS